MKIRAMNLIEYLDGVISGKRKGFFPALMRLQLLEISLLSFGLIKLRNQLYSSRIIKSKSLPCKVISVGNIVVGDTGKTPTVISIAKMLRESANLKIAILLRGYKSKIHGNTIVSDGNNILHDQSEVGDEPYLIAKKLSDIPVIIGKDRIKSGLMAVKNFNTQVVILDDGFQYLKLNRDVNILIVDSTQPYGYGYILPRGYLREPLYAVERADIILLTKVDQCNDLNSLYKKLRMIAPSVPIFESIHRPTSLYAMNENENLPLDNIKGKNILAVCGIANPLSFYNTLKSLYPSNITLMKFPDHHEYTIRDINMIRQKMQETKSDYIVITEKDSMKLNVIRDLPVLVLKIELELVGSGTEFTSLIMKYISCSTT